ncbi:MAG: type II toxin-antitoxin system VapC family toxin [Rhodospirillales bacterium]|nr:type II toxin-antitoxin system VapC family toxin [Rhodospirillales bacterium]
MKTGREAISAVVLDASAVLALLNGEPGAEAVSNHLPGAYLSAVNAAEVAGKLVDGGASPEQAGQVLDRLGARIAAFDRDDVVPAARLRAASRSFGLSLGDRACLALALRLGQPALTADRAWQDLETSVEVRLIRA